MFSKRIFFIPLILTIASCSSNTNPETAQSEAKKYPIINLSKTDTILQLDYVADIQASKNVEIHARVEGLLDKVFVDEGQSVRKGQVLFKINDSELKIDLNRTIAAYNSAVADARVAQVEVERVAVLVEKNVVAKSELDLSKAKYAAFQAKTQQALAEKDAVQRRISYTTIVAPFDGIIDRIPLKQGSLITNGSLLTTLSDINSMYAYFNLSENEYYELLRNKETEKISEINLQLSDGSLFQHSGTLEAAESEINMSTGSIAYRVNFANPQRLLKHGSSGKILITKPMNNIFLIPQQAVYEIQDKNYIYTLEQGEVVKLKNINPTHRIANYYVVEEGLNGNEKIVSEGIQALRDGEKITPVTK